MIGRLLADMGSKNQYCEAKRIVKAVSESRGIPHRRWRTFRCAVGNICWLLLAPIHLCGRLRMRISHPDARSDLRSIVKHSIRRERHGNVEVDNGSAWTTTMGFYAACGGLVGRRDHGVPKALSTRWIIHIAKHEPHMLPILRHDQILDKSKASSLTKMITCVQAFWFCTSCITRLCDRKATSLLELNTFGHCICAFIIYLFWWHKPHDVISHSASDHDLCRYEAIVSRCEGAYGHGDGMDKSFNKSSHDLAEVWPSSPSQSNGAFGCICRVRLGGDTQSNLLLHIGQGEIIPGTGFKVERGAWLSGIRNGKASYCLSQKRLALWQELWAIRERCSWPKSDTDESPVKLDKLLVQRKSNLLTGRYEIFDVCVAGGCFTIYGFLQFIAWFYAFSSRAERRLWRASSMNNIIFVPSMSLAYNLLKCAEYPLLCALLLIVSVNGLARSFLLIESFIALPSSPSSVY